MSKIITTNYKNIELRRTSYGSLIIGLKPNICKYNVLTIDTLDELIDALEYHVDNKVKALIIAPSAHSENFGVGADLNVINSGDKDKVLELLAKGTHVCNKIDTITKRNIPTVAVIEGLCYGGSLELALSCDHIFCIENMVAKLRFPEFDLGLIPGFTGIKRIYHKLKTYFCSGVGSAKTIDVALYNTIDLLSSGVDYNPGSELPNQLIDLGIDTVSGIEEIEARIFDNNYKDIVNNIIENDYNVIDAFMSLYDNVYAKNSKLNLHLGIIGRGTIGTQLIKYIKNHGENVFNRVTIVNNHHIGEPSTPKECGNFIVLNTQNLSDLNNCDIIIECINEDREKKISLFEQIDDIAKKECIFLTTSSSYSISELGKSIHHSLIGFHVFNPMEKIRLVEMPYISGTEEYFDRYQFIIDIAEKLELEPMKIDGSVFGSGIVNPILMTQINTACNVSKFVHCDIIDSMMKNITGCNMGPLETADLIGLDVCLDILEHLEINDETYHPSDVLKDKVKKGHLGIKSGLGFYDYQKRI